MKQSVSILSDLHIDFYIHQKDPIRIKSKDVERIFENVLDSDPEVDLLIVAGDLGHHNAQSFQVLKYIAEIFNYKKIFVVAGNHELYSGSKYGTLKRQETFKDFIDPKGIIEVLDGTVVEYKGVRYGGFDGWYDGTYLGVMGSDLDLIDFWRYSLNDSKYCHLPSFIPKFLEERKKAAKIYKECDVLISHINPSNRKEHQLPQYREDLSTAFYNWDGAMLLRDTTAKYFIYGHCHGQFQYETKGVKCILNAHGYPHEPKAWLTIDMEFTDVL